MCSTTLEVLQEKCRGATEVRKTDGKMLGCAAVETNWEVGTSDSGRVRFGLPD